MHVVHASQLICSACQPAVRPSGGRIITSYIYMQMVDAMGTTSGLHCAPGRLVNTGMPNNLPWVFITCVCFARRDVVSQGQLRLHAGVTRHILLELIRQDLKHLPLPMRPTDIEGQGPGMAHWPPPRGPRPPLRQASAHTIVRRSRCSSGRVGIGTRCLRSWRMRTSRRCRVTSACSRSWPCACAHRFAQNQPVHARRLYRNGD